MLVSVLFRVFLFVYLFAYVSRPFARVLCSRLFLMQVVFHKTTVKSLHPKGEGGGGVAKTQNLRPSLLRTKNFDRFSFLKLRVDLNIAMLASPAAKKSVFLLHTFSDHSTSFSQSTSSSK